MRISLLRTDRKLRGSIDHRPHLFLGFFLLRNRQSIDMTPIYDNNSTVVVFSSIEIDKLFSFFPPVLLYHRHLFDITTLLSVAIGAFQ